MAFVFRRAEDGRSLGQGPTATTNFQRYAKGCHQGRGGYADEVTVKGLSYQ